MKKILFILILLLSTCSVYASYNSAAAFFNNYNKATGSNFTYNNDSYKKDAKYEKYGSQYKPRNPDNYDCKYDSSGSLRCGKYKLNKGETQEKSVALNKQIIADYKKAKKMKNISSGDDFNCALDDGDAVFCWGSNKRGQLGTKAVTKESKKPVKVDSKLKFKKIYTNAHYACGLDLGGSAYCWGDGTNGEVGNGKKGYFDTPQKVKTDVVFTRLSMAETYTCGVEKLTNDIYCWGKGTKGLSSTLNLDSTTPVAI